MIPSTMTPPIEFTTDNCCTLPLDLPIALYERDTEALTPFTATAVQLTLIKGAGDRFPTSQATHLRDCHLVLSVSLSQYQHVLQQSLFHLKPEVRGPLQKADFSPDSPILLELGLQPYFFAPSDEAEDLVAAAHRTPVLPLLKELLEILERQTDDVEINDCLLTPAVDALLKTLLGKGSTIQKADSEISSSAASMPEAIAPWLKTDSWLCRSVQQQQADQTVGYATLWAYTTPEQTDSVRESGTAVLGTIANLLQKTTGAVRAEVEQELPQLQQGLSQFSDHLITALEQVDWNRVVDSAAPPELTNSPISKIVKQFFDEDDWAYVQLPGVSVLQLSFQGDAGRWTCLAQSDDEAEQVVFYSLCPITVPADKSGAIVELLMRANDGLIIGNFELDFERGSIRYKTSLDVEGDRLTSALMRQLVYINVQTLDRYLPSILAVLEGRHTPAEAIAAIEQPEGVPETSDDEA